jgi:WD40 repeat protein
VVKLWDVRTGLLRELGRHRDWITTLAVSPDGSRLATGSGDDTVLLFDLTRGGEPRALGPHGDTVRGLLFSADGQLLVSLDYTSTVRIWDPESGEAIRTFRTGTRRETRLESTSDGQAVVASGSGGAHVWPLAVQRNRVLRGHRDAVITLDWSPDGRRLVTGGRDATVHVWDSDGASLGSTALDSWITLVRFLSSGNVLASTRLARAWTFDPSEEQARPLADMGTNAAAMAPAAVLSAQRDRIAYAQGDTVVIQDIATGRKMSLAAHLSAVRDLQFSSDGRRVAVLSVDGTVGLWSTSDGRPQLIRQLGERIDQIELSDDGRWAAIRTDLGRLTLWELGPDRLERVSAGGPVVDVHFFTRNGEALVYEGPGSSIVVLDMAARTTRVLRGHRAHIQEVSLSPTAPLMASADGAGFVRLWNLQTEETAVLLAHPGPIERLAFSPDGQRLATAVADSTIRIWNVEALLAGTVRQPLAAHTSTVVDESHALRTPASP